MIAPIMIAIIADALRAVPRGWTEGAAALGVNRWRVMWTIAVRAARPAIVAGAVLATARALGEAIMLAMVSGGVDLLAQPARRPDLLLRADAAARGDDRRQTPRASRSTPFGQTLYAFAAVLLVSSAVLSLAGWAGEAAAAALRGAAR